jgi:hypothetical protein
MIIELTFGQIGKPVNEATSSSCSRHPVDVDLREVELSTAVHLALDELELVNFSFRLAVGQWLDPATKFGVEAAYHVTSPVRISSSLS